jgi:hypothetical protein
MARINIDSPPNSGRQWLEAIDTRRGPADSQKTTPTYAAGRHNRICHKLGQVRPRTAWRNWAPQQLRRLRVAAKCAKLGRRMQ